MSAAEVIAEALGQAHADVRDAGPDASSTDIDTYVAEAVLTAIRAMTPAQMAEVIGGYVDEGYFATIDGRLHRRALGPWREVQP